MYFRKAGRKEVKFYDIDALESKCGSDNKYKITAMVAARARWLSEKKTALDALPANEKYLSAALLEIELGEFSGNWLEETAKTEPADKAVND